jgi:hypothetical protein
MTTDDAHPTSVEKHEPYLLDRLGGTGKLDVVASVPPTIHCK